MNNRNIGTYYEEAAVSYLLRANVEILERQFKCRRLGEIDIIGIDRGEDYGEALVFFEVKYRKDDKTGHPLMAVDLKKQKTIRRCAEYYLAYRADSRYIRFDVIAICGEEITWIKNAF